MSYELKVKDEIKNKVLMCGEKRPYFSGKRLGHFGQKVRT